MTAPEPGAPRNPASNTASSTAGPPCLIDRDIDAVTRYLDAWILGAEPDHDPASTWIPLLGTPEWVAADNTAKSAAVALYVLACLAEREPVVIAARLAAEIAAARTAHLAAMRQASHAISAALADDAIQGPKPNRGRRPTRSSGRGSS